MVRYIDAGSKHKTPVIFLHGFPFSLEMWKGQIDVVSQSYRAIAYDIRGHGLSDVGDDPLTLEGHVDDLIELLDHLQLPKATLVGFSMGGYIALRAVERNPERFGALVLCDTKSEADSNEDKLNRFKAMKEVKAHGSRAFADGFIKKVFAPESLITKPAVVEAIHTMITSTNAKNIAATLLALAARTDTTSSLANIAIPTLILVGEKDTITPPHVAKAMHENIQNSEFYMIPQASHMSNLENPGEFNRRLLDFLKKQASL